jgi:hypothetical protein
VPRCPTLCYQPDPRLDRVRDDASTNRGRPADPVAREGARRRAARLTRRPEVVHPSEKGSLLDGGAEPGVLKAHLESLAEVAGTVQVPALHVEPAERVEVAGCVVLIPDPFAEGQSIRQDSQGAVIRALAREVAIDASPSTARAARPDSRLGRGGS